MSTIEAARLFDESFLAQARHLEAELQNIASLATPQDKSKTLNTCFEELASLQRSVQDAASYSNNHDQAVYAATLKKLQASAEGVRNAITPKTKFKFKSARSKATPDANTPITAPGPATESSTATSDSSDSTPAHADAYDILKNGQTQITGAILAISTPRLNELPARTVRNVSMSVIDLTTHETKPAASLSITNVSQSILFCGSINGPLHMTSVKSSLVFAKAHQIRIHDCEDVTLYLDIGSQPVIERCSSMRFGPFGSQARDFWCQVLDFQYPGGDSPNWSPVLDKAVVAGSGRPIDSLRPGDLGSEASWGSLAKTLAAGGIVESLDTSNGAIDQTQALAGKLV